jgi:RecT family
MTQVAAAAARTLDGDSELTRLLQGDYSPRYMLEGDSMDKMMRLAEQMATSKLSVPEHLRGNIGDCLAIITQAMLWNMNPFAVAQKTHVVSGRLGYEAQLVIAVVQNSGAIRGAIRFEYRGADEVRAGAVLRGETEVTWGEWLSASSVTTKNSPLWKTNPRQQMSYLQAKNWSRLYCPGAILGVYSVDELEDSPLPVARTEEPQKPADKPALPPYDQAAFDKNLPQWRAIVESGRKTGAALLTMFSTKNTFTPEQQAALKALDARPAEEAKPAAGPGSDDFAAEYAAAEEGVK